MVGLEFQGLTGVAAISLKGGEASAPPVPQDDDGVPVLTADPNALQDVTEAIRATLQNVNRLVADNQQSIKNSLHNLETFTGALARNSEKIDNVMARVDGVMGKADSLMLGLNSIGGGATGGELAAMVKAIKELADDLDKRTGALDGRRPPHALRHQPRREQFRPQPEPRDFRRRQCPAGGGAAGATADEAARPRRGKDSRSARSSDPLHLMSSTGEQQCVALHVLGQDCS